MLAQGKDDKPKSAEKGAVQAWFKSAPFGLKDGRRAVLRCPKDEDIPGTLEYLRLSAAETEFLLRSPEECDRFTYDGERAFFENVNASDSQLMLVCVVEGRVAGSCHLTFKTHIKNRHRCEVGIALLREFWGQGVGTKMFETMIAAARDRGGILQMELEVFEGNDRARRLYERMGFRITAVRPNAIRLSDGALRNEYIMIRTME